MRNVTYILLEERMRLQFSKVKDGNCLGSPNFLRMKQRMQMKALQRRNSGCLEKNPGKEPLGPNPNPNLFQGEVFRGFFTNTAIQIKSDTLYVSCLIV